MQTVLESLKNKNIIERLLLLFILVQPFIDLATSLAVKFEGSQFTAGIFIRFAIMAIGVGYVFFISDSKNKKSSIIYIVILCLFAILNFANNMLVKHPMSKGDEIKFILKSIYFVLIFYSYLYVFKQLQAAGTWKSSIQRYIVFAMTVVGVVMVVADSTNTAFKSYTYNKVGQTGWFYAGNEIGAVMSICFPLIVFYAIKKTTSIKKIYYWIPALLLIYSLMAVGTKVGFGSVLITIVISLIMLIIDTLKKKTDVPNLKLNLIVNIVVLVLFALYIPFSPIAENTSIHLSLLKSQQSKNHTKKQQGENTDNPNLDNQQLANLVLSGRGAYLNQQKKYFVHAPISQKVLGMGYAGNYKKSPKMIEMDFYDLFFSFGILGFIIYFIPFLLFSLAILKRFFTDFKTHFTLENILVICGIILGIGIGFSAGHVFTAPAVSIYLAVLVAYLYMQVVKPSS